MSPERTVQLQAPEICETTTSIIAWAVLGDMQMLTDVLDTGADARGLEVSLGGLAQDQLVQREV